MQIPPFEIKPGERISFEQSGPIVSVVAAVGNQFSRLNAKDEADIPRCVDLALRRIRFKCDKFREMVENVPE